MDARILIVDDVATERLILSRLLQNLGFTSVASENGWDALEKLQSESFDLMMLDLSMPEIDGVEVLRQLRENSDQKDLPVIVMSSSSASKLAARCLELGAEDYLVKPIDPSFLSIRIQSTLERYRLRRLQSHQLEQMQQLREDLERRNQELKAANLRLENLAFSDSLTGLPNRRASLDTLQHYWANRERSGRALSLILADIDHFKRINDTFGHGVGDQVIRSVGQTLQSLLRGGDVVGRYGGEEFLVICPDTDLESARRVAERLRRGIEEMNLSSTPLQEPVTVSLGVAEARGSVKEKESVIEWADQALYQAKGEGRNRVACYRHLGSPLPPEPESQPLEVGLSSVLDPARLRLLQETGLMDSPGEEIFDRFTRLAARLTHSPISLLALVGEDRQFFKSQFGLHPPLDQTRQTPISHSFCRHVVESGAPLVVPEARKHPELQNNPAIQALGVEAYLGVPLVVEGQLLGSFCVIDHQPRPWSEEEQLTLADLASAATAEIELRLSLMRQKQLARAFQEAKEGAEAANRAKSDFLSSATHELRTPLNGIIGISELLQGTSLNSQQLEYTQLLRLSADSLLELVNDVLDLAKIEAGHFELRPSPWNVRESLSQWLKPLALRANKEGLKLVLDIHPEVPQTLLLDGGRLRQVVLNLVGNALKFTSVGSIQVGVFYQSSQGLRCEVKDSGCGIPASQLTAIFEAFSQVQESRRRQIQGTGLGLAIVKRLVNLMGGQVQCSSQIGQGSSFQFWLPAPASSTADELPWPSPSPGVVWVSDLAQRQALSHLMQSFPCFQDWRFAQDPSQVQQPSQLLLGIERDDVQALELVANCVSRQPLRVALVSAPGWEPTPGWLASGLSASASFPLAPSDLLWLAMKLQQNPAPVGPVLGKLDNGPQLRILVLEDNLVNQKVIRAMLERMGHWVYLTSSGSQALRQLEEGLDIDLGLIDLEMPEMTGIEFAQRLRRQGHRLPLVALTANALVEVRQHCLEAGMNHYLSKPITLSALQELLSLVGPQATR